MSYAKTILAKANNHAIDCFLDGVDGKKEALAIANGNTMFNIVALDASILIGVRRSTVNLKLEQEDKPTFYYS
jgi:hypothetical protein